MYCDYPLDNDSTLEINLKISTLFESLNGSTDENDFGITNKHQ